MSNGTMIAIIAVCSLVLLGLCIFIYFRFINNKKRKLLKQDILNHNLGPDSKGANQPTQNKIKPVSGNLMGSIKQMASRMSMKKSSDEKGYVMANDDNELSS